MRKAVKHAARFQSLTPFARGAGSQQVGQRYVLFQSANHHQSFAPIHGCGNAVVAVASGSACSADSKLARPRCAPPARTGPTAVRARGERAQRVSGSEGGSPHARRPQVNHLPATHAAMSRSAIMIAVVRRCTCSCELGPPLKRVGYRFRCAQPAVRATCESTYTGSVGRRVANTLKFSDEVLDRARVCWRFACKQLLTVTQSNNTELTETVHTVTDRVIKRPRTQAAGPDRARSPLPLPFAPTAPASPRAAPG